MAFSEPPTLSSSPMSTILSTAITTIKDTVFVTTFETELINATLTDAPVPYYITILKSVQKWLITAILVFIMLAMGAVISLEDFKQTFRHPVGFFVGFASQFITMPLICFVFALVLKLEPPFALGLLIIGCCPGGTVSNLFTFWTDGDICLSVCMTTVSCIAAIGMMPLNLFIYSRRWTTEQTKIPFINIFTTLVTIIVPAVAGMIIRRFSLKWAGRVSQTAFRPRKTMCRILTPEEEDDMVTWLREHTFLHDESSAEFKLREKKRRTWHEKEAELELYPGDLSGIWKQKMGSYFSSCSELHRAAATAVEAVATRAAATAVEASRNNTFRIFS
ncbi:ileal sodium/bile acid cotransporter-like [Diadema antillarum]|uniref:ileal sodium/bile acid cotransporter-like n=1 Tax=Diadema antillarum TaxID=105358 RepID=UPI003A8B2A56